MNAFLLLVTIGSTLYFYVSGKAEGSEGEGHSSPSGEKENDLRDRNHSPLQLISQLKGYFHINAFLAVSFGITLFSFVGIPPLVGFFAKQMVLSAALDQGYVFLSLVAILTSVIGAGYYLSVIKQVFFFEHDYAINPGVMQRGGHMTFSGSLTTSQGTFTVPFSFPRVLTASAFSSLISFNTLVLSLFILIPAE